MALRPKFHFTAIKNWINDPNGFSVYGGRVHLFYQYNPYGVKWGNMSWGHAVSDDMIRWDHLEPALLQDKPYDINGVFSGTAYVDGDKHHLFYTGISEDKDKASGNSIAYQCHAVSTDGIRYEKDVNNPVVKADGSIMSLDDFRDPKVWRHDGTYYMLVGSQAGGKGQAAVYRSDDMMAWEYFTMIGKDNCGIMWECPDLLEFDEESYLMFSAMETGTPEFPHEVVVAPCSLDYSTGNTWVGETEKMDWGKTFYAPQTLVHNGDETVMIGWLMMKEPFDISHSWTGMMSLPRIIELRDGVMHYRPHPNLYEYLTETVHLETDKVYDTENTYCLSFEAGLNQDWAVRLMAGEGEGVLLAYDSETRKMTLDKTACIIGTPALEGVASILETPALSGEEAGFEIIVDKSVIEIFANSGRYVISTLVYPAAGEQSIEFIDKHGIIKEKKLLKG